ncbi:aminotransferase class V-fold PLP-dependent enzyme [Acidisphaera sp. L21]|uniref:aminotransferase class V-fold PLP-dependent enzyme n=1 Tax=Acidisphaera sp. L21 TaxID=1641851 RepID=UPI00131E6812|nr:aminotransferase class V-fold PLP-dependent enzyme [Acidisphaera sp. L21]
MTRSPLFDPAAFRIPLGVAHVCAGGEAAFLRRHAAAFEQYAVDKSNAPRGRVAQEAEVDRARHLSASLFSVTQDTIGFVSSVAEGMSMLVESLDWQDGDNVCLDPDEYPSLVAPLQFALPPNVEIRFVKMRELQSLARQLDDRTRLLAVSHVSYLNGARHDLAGLRRATDAVGAMLVVDHTQAAGYLPIEAGPADFAFAATYKWALGMTGTAIAYWNRQRHPAWRPNTAGWHSIATGDRPDYASRPALRPDAMRFTRGNPSHASVYVLASALGYLAGFAPGDVQAPVQGLTTDLLARLARQGIASTTPPNPAEHGASVCIEGPQAAEVVTRLQERGVFAWNGRGRIRFSFHGYNGTADVDAIEAGLQAVWRG